MSDFLTNVVIGIVLFILYGGYKEYKRAEEDEYKQIKRLEKALKKSERAVSSGNDFLGNAAKFKHKGLDAIKDKKYNQAWKMFNQQKQCLINHANEQKFNKQQTLSIDASVSENLANILRLEGKHNDALIHIIYWVSTSAKRTKAQNGKLNSYFNRAKLTGIALSQIEDFISEGPDFRSIRDQLQKWSNFTN